MWCDPDGWRTSHTEGCVAAGASPGHRSIEQTARTLGSAPRPNERVYPKKSELMAINRADVQSTSPCHTKPLNALSRKYHHPSMVIHMPRIWQFSGYTHENLSSGAVWKALARAHLARTAYWMRWRMPDCAQAASSGTPSASQGSTRSSLSRAKFMTKSQAMGS